MTECDRVSGCEQVERTLGQPFFISMQPWGEEQKCSFRFFAWAAQKHPPRIKWPFYFILYISSFQAPPPRVIPSPTFSFAEIDSFPFAKPSSSFSPSSKSDEAGIESQTEEGDEEEEASSAENGERIEQVTLWADGESTVYGHLISQQPIYGRKYVKSVAICLWE